MRVSVADDVLTIDLGVKETLLACKRCVRVPLAHVRGAQEGIPGRRVIDIRVFGSFIPGRLKAGTFYTREGKEFWFVEQGRRNYVTIDLAPEAPFRRVVLGLDDVSPIRAAIGIEAAEMREDAVVA